MSSLSELVEFRSFDCLARICARCRPLISSFLFVARLLQQLQQKHSVLRKIEREEKEAQARETAQAKEAAAARAAKIPPNVRRHFEVCSRRFSRRFSTCSGFFWRPMYIRVACYKFHLLIDTGIEKSGSFGKQSRKPCPTIPGVPQTTT